MPTKIPLRQRVRKFLIILSFLLFPITINYLSPYIIIDGASNGIVNGSLIMFALMFVSSLFLGRLWCGWVCPGAGIEEIVEPVNSARLNGPKIDWIKWLIWVPWLALIGWLVVKTNGFHRINFFHLTDSGISVDAPNRYIIYYAVVALFIGLAIFVGRRAACHTICWMAPFMITGRWIRNRFGWPSLRLQANPTACSSCKTCTANCPMSLDVNGMVQRNNMENAECILCGTCVDNCPKYVIKYTFRSGS